MSPVSTPVHSPKLALITGASRGLGRNIALHLARGGADIIGTFRNSATEAASLHAEITALGRTALLLPLDVADAAQRTAFVAALPDRLAQTFSRRDFDFLVNNAGIGVYADFTKTTEAQFDELVAIQLKAPFFFTQALLATIVDGGRILNVSSGLARFSLPGYAAYAAMKGAIEVLTRYQAVELGGRGISVNVIAPGAIETDFGGGIVRDNPAVNAHIAATTAMGRAGLPDDVGAAAASLLLSERNWITGERVEISGGQNL